jgi:protein SCO1
MRRRFFASALLMAITAAAVGPRAALAADLYAGRAVWLDDREQPFSMRALAGTPTVLTLAYGACRRVCSSSLRVMQQIQLLADQRRVQMNFVVVGIDPSEDHPIDWAHLRTARGLGRSNWYFLTGTDTAIHQLARRLDVHYWRYGDHTLHDFRIVLLSADGEIVSALDAADQSPERLLP